MELFLVRHAEPVRIVNADGPANPELTPAGNRQAERLAAWLMHDSIDHVVSSPLLRARETAAPLADQLKQEIVIEPRISEYDAHSNEYIPVEELLITNPDWKHEIVAGQWNENGGPTPEEFRDTVVAGFESIIERFSGQRVVVVCHGGTINVYLAHVLNNDRQMWFYPHYTSISRVHASRSGMRSIGSVNETGHLHGTRESFD